jgi:hypothetical protein
MNRPLTPGTAAPRAQRLNKRSDRTSEAIEQEKRSNVSRLRKPLLPLVLVSLVSLVLAGTGNAQTTKTFTPRIDIFEQYDDNIDLTRNNKKSDWITTVGPGFNVGVDSEHTKLNLDCFAGYSFYAKDSSRNTTSLGSTLSLDQRLSSHFSVRATDAFARTEDPITTENGVVTDVSRKRSVRYHNTGEAGLSYQFGADYGMASQTFTRVGTSGFEAYQLVTANRLTAGYRNRLLESRSDQDEDSLGNEGFFTLATWFGPRFGTELTGGITRATFEQPNDFTGEPTEDFYGYTGAVTLNYRWEPSRRVYVGYQVREHRFDQTRPETGTQNYLVHQPMVGVSLGLGPNTTFDAEGGYWYQNVYGGNSRNGPAFGTALSTRQERLTLRVGGSGGYDESYFTSENLGFAKYYQAVGNADYQLTQALACFASGSYRWEKYYDTTEGTTNQPTDRTDKTWHATAGFRYAFLRYLTFSLDGTHTELSSTEKDQEFTDNRATARLTWAYGIPF